MKLNDQEVKQEVEMVKETKAKKSTKIESKQKVEITEDNLGVLVPEWKAKFGRLYKNLVDGEIYIWKPLRRGEYKELLKLNDDADVEDRFLLKQEAVVAMAVLFPANIDEVIQEKAGLATVLSEEILAKSGFDISETEAL